MQQYVIYNSTRRRFMGKTRPPKESNKFFETCELIPVGWVKDPARATMITEPSAWTLDDDEEVMEFFKAKLFYITDLKGRT